MAATEEVSRLFQQYVQKLPTSSAEEYQVRSDLVAEVAERLKQLEFILTQVQKLQSQLGRVAIVERIDAAGEKAFFNANAELDQHNIFALRLLTESFYYFAFRVRQIFRHKMSPFPELRSFESSGVRDVRNHLIEHPEGADSRIFSQVFSFSPGAGMQLKAGRSEHEVGRHEDAGLTANSSEFYENMSKSLSAALAYVACPGSK